MSKPAPSPAEPARWHCDDPDCGWTEDEHIAFGGGKALQCPHPPPVEAASEVPAFNKSADATHVKGTAMYTPGPHPEATSEVLTRDDYVDTVRHECDSVGSCGVLLAHDAALRAALKKAEEARDEAMKQRDPAVVMAARLIAQNADKHPAGCCYKCSEGLAQRNAAEARVAEAAELLERTRPEDVEHTHRLRLGCWLCDYERWKAAAALNAKP